MLPTGNPLTVWVLQTGEPLHLDAGDRRPMRAMNLANALVAAGHKVVVWTAAFSHQERRQRARTPTRVPIAESLEYRLIPSPGYDRNIGLGRLADHAVLAKNLSRMLRDETPPDVCFIGYPPIEAAAVMARWQRVRGVPSLLDVKDQWPTLLLDALPASARPLGRVALAPYYGLARRAMRDATAISAMAAGYLTWVQTFSGRPDSPYDLVAPLTSPNERCDEADLEEARRWWDARGVSADGKQRFCFVGSHTRSFDFAPVAEAARSLAASHPTCELVICGTGELSAQWQQMTARLPNVRFPGWVDRSHIHVLADRSVGFIAPYVRSEAFDRSIPNKVIDAFSLGLPLVTSLGGEVGELIREFDVGLRYGDATGRTLHDCIIELAKSELRRQQMSANALRLFEQRFEFHTVYGKLVRRLEELAAARGLVKR